MTRPTKKALNPNGVSAPNVQAKGSNRNTYQGETIMDQITSIPTTTDKDYRGFVPATVMTAAGFIVKPDDLMMQSLVNGDNSRSVDRARFYLVHA